MKKLLLLSLVAVMALSLGACNRKNANEAQVKVTVKNASGTPQKNARVHLYMDTRPNRSSNASDAKETKTTDNYGVATFDLNLKNMNIAEGQTNLYFAVFYQLNDESLVVGSAAVAIKNGDVKEIKITIPI